MCNPSVQFKIGWGAKCGESATLKLEILILISQMDSYDFLPKGKMMIHWFEAFRLTFE